MAASLSRFPVLCVLFAMLPAFGAAKNAAPAPAVDCSSLVLNMADCLSYVTAGGTAQKPEGTCCSGLKTVLKADPECICEAFRNSAQLGVTLNMTKALALPSACHVSAPSVSNCGLSSGSGAAPALSPMALSPGAVAGAPIASIGGAEGAPAPAPAAGSSGSFAIAASLELVVLATLAIFVSFAWF